MVKLVHIPRTQISIDEKCLKHYHVLNTMGKCYDIQLVTMELDQQCVGLHDPNNL
jgi:hypothetical protein